MNEIIRVLHVDDDSQFTDLSTQFLRRENEQFEVVAEMHPTDALDQLRGADQEFHCLVSDYALPELSGIELLKVVREEFPDLPFILYTGKGSEEVASEAIRAGVTDYLQKESGTSQYEVLANRIENAVEQHRAQVVANETEHRLRTIAENTSDILWKFTSDWNELLFINSPYEEIWGRSKTELSERPQSFLDGIHPDDRDLVKDAMGQLSSGVSIDIEFRVNAAEDFGRWVWMKGQPVYDDSEAVAKVVGFAQDITLRKEREQEILDLETKYRSITEDVLDATEVGIFVLDADFHVAWCSRATEAFFGIDRDEVVGSDKHQVIEEEIAAVFEDPARFEEVVLGTYDDNTYTERFECHVLPGNGRADRWLSHLSHPIESGLFEGGRVEIYTDITNQK